MLAAATTCQEMQKSECTACRVSCFAYSEQNILVASADAPAGQIH